jgi:hypothetical protein
VILIPAAVAPLLLPPLCPSCPDRMTVWTGCTACLGFRCDGCGEGCDIDTRPEHGECATATDASNLKETER